MIILDIARLSQFFDVSPDCRYIADLDLNVGLPQPQRLPSSSCHSNSAAWNPPQALPAVRDSLTHVLIHSFLIF